MNWLLPWKDLCALCEKPFVSFAFKQNLTMENGIPEAEQLEDELVGELLFESHYYWFKKRLLFNILVGLSGFLCLFFSSFNLFFFIPSLIIWAVIANALYSLGYVLESYLITQSARGKGFSKSFRKLLFWSGTLAYMAATIMACLSSILV